MGEVEAKATHVVSREQTAERDLHHHSQVPRYWGIQCKVNNSRSDGNRCRWRFLRPWFPFGRFLMMIASFGFESF